MTAPAVPLKAKPYDGNAAVKRTITTPSAGFRRRLPARRMGDISYRHEDRRLRSDGVIPG